MRLFGSQNLMQMFNSLGMPEGEQIQHKMLNKAIERAQKKIESNNYGIRKNLLEYDQINNEQREIIYAERRKVLDGDDIERVIILKVTDSRWMDHIDDMDQLRQGIGLQAFGQRDPVVEYRLQGYDMFNDMTESIREETVKMLMHVRIEQKVEREQVAEVTGTNKDDSANAPVVRKSEKISRNAPCPCGSGKKYKYCCGR